MENSTRNGVHSWLRLDFYRDFWDNAAIHNQGGEKWRLPKLLLKAGGLVSAPL